MRFIRKKNLHEGEELLYLPRMHWIYTLKHMIQSLPFFLLLLILWSLANSQAGLAESLWGLGTPLLIMYTIRNIFLVSLIIILLVFTWRIFLYLSCEYGVTNRRLIIKKGIIRLTIAEIPTDRIESIYCVQGLMGRIFRYGTIYISGVGGMMPTFFMVSRPYALRRKIVEIIEKNKAITVFHGDFPKPRPESKPVPVIEEEPMHRYGTFVRVIK